MNGKEKALFEKLLQQAWNLYDNLPEERDEYRNALAQIEGDYKKIQETKTKKPKEPTLFKICLLIGDYDAGLIVDVKMETDGELYYYDEDHRWCYITKDQEGLAWERHGKRQKHDPAKFKKTRDGEWVKCEDGLVRWFPKEEIKEPEVEALLGVIKTDRGYLKKNMNNGIEFTENRDEARAFTAAEIMAYGSSISADLRQFGGISEIAMEIINGDE